MMFSSRIAIVLIGISTVAAMAEQGVFAFIPEGGRTVLERLMDAGLDADVLVQATAAPASAQDWADRLAQDGLPGSATLDEWQRQTLADYLAYAGPLADRANLPPDGRDLALAQCQSCHIITVVVTQDRPREAWLGTLAKPSHVEVPMTPAERGQLADYLVVNGGIPIDDVPVELRAGGASY